MRFVFAVLGALCFWSQASAQDTAGADYVLSIDGKDFDLAIGQESTITLKSGNEAKVILKKREFGTFTTGDLSFEFPGAFTVASTPVDGDTTQHLVATALGTVMLVQSYENGVPTGILNLMYDKMIEEPKALGVEVVKSELRRTISGNQILEGVRAHYKADDDDVTIDIVTTKAKRGGFMVLTLHDNFTAPEEKKMIERFWSTLKLQQ